MGEDYYLGKEETTAFVFGTFFYVVFVIFDVGEVVKYEGLDGPVRGEGIGGTTMD